MKFFKKLFTIKPDTQIYTLPTLHLRFVNGDEADVVPKNWHINDGHWSRYYLEDGLVLGRYPLASLLEVYEVSREQKTIEYNFESLYLPLYISNDHMQGDHLTMERDGWHSVKISSKKVSEKG